MTSTVYDTAVGNRCIALLHCTALYDVTERKYRPKVTHLIHTDSTIPADIESSMMHYLCDSFLSM